MNPLENDIYMAKVRKLTKEVHGKTHTQEELLKELGAEFGRRIRMAEKQGIPTLVAFEAAKLNFRDTGRMMIFIADNITAEYLPAAPVQPSDNESGA